MHDLIGVGFGPANLGLAIALDEQDGRPLEPLFLERSPRFTWHSGMLLRGATMQISFLKDLVTLRDPRSRFSFLCYLQDRGRLVDFVNRQDFFPTRREFHDYLEWAAASFADAVRYGCEVRSVLPVRTAGGEVGAFDVVATEASGRERTYRTRRLVIGSGLRPRMPEGLAASRHVWHSSELLHRLDARPDFDPKRLVVVGAGQSAAEATAHLHERFSAAQVIAVLPRYGYSAADDSAFANRLFDPAAVDDFYTAPRAVKERMYAYHANTNYSVVDPGLIDELFGRLYDESVTGENRLQVRKMSEVSVLDEEPDGVRLRVASLIDGSAEELRADAVVFATGYHPMDPAPLLGGAAELCVRTDDGGFRVRRDYRLETLPGVAASIYLQGGTEHTHGISASLLSNTAGRAWDIAQSCRADADRSDRSDRAERVAESG
jgi:L-ornithine N5-monooxygenase